jgi:AcrR family transcriptional regulator
MKASRSYTMGARADGVVATKERITREALALFLEHSYDDVTLAAIAAAAGVSHQTVLNHFESKEGVVLAVADVLGRETISARHAALPGDIDGAIRALVGEYERFGDANVRWAVAADRLPTLAALLDDARTNHRQWLVTMFGAWLPTDRRTRRRTINALHAATDVYAWRLLRRDLHLSRAETERTLVDLVVAITKGTGT